MFMAGLLQIATRLSSYQREHGDICTRHVSLPLRHFTLEQIKSDLSTAMYCMQKQYGG